MTPRVQTLRRSSPVAIARDDVAPRRGRPPRLSRPAILAKALALIDDEGADALTMRRLGAELGVEAMSLYRYVANKRALLDGVAEQMMSQVDGCLDDQGSDWEQTIRDLLLGIRAVAWAHPAAFELVGMRALNTSAAVRPIERLLADLRAGGFSPDRSVTIFRVLAGFVRGYAMCEIVGFTLSSTGEDPSRLTARGLPVTEFPTVRALARQLSSEPTDAQFTAGLEMILDALRRELAATAQPAAPARR